MIFSYHFILLRYARESVERPAVRSEAKRFALSVEYRYYPSCIGISQIVKKKRKFQLHVLRWISRVFLDEKHIPSGFGNRRTAGLPRCTARQEVELEPIDSYRRQGRNFCGAFGFPFFFYLRPSNMLKNKRDWNLFCLRKVIGVGSSGST